MTQILEQPCQIRPYVGIGVVVKKENKILLGQRKNSHGAGCWALPGGHLEFKESPEECAKRELLEETGLEALCIKEGPWINSIIEDKHYITIFMLVEGFEGVASCLEPDKCEGWDWFDIGNLPSPLFAPLASFLKKFPL